MRALAAMLLAGCPDAEPMQVGPPAHEPTAPCVGFGLEFWGPTLSDRDFFGTSASWRGEAGDEPKPIARGGIENVYVYGEPWIGPGVPTFEPAVTAGALAISDADRLQPVGVAGIASGVGDLCIYDVGATDVHDGTRLVVRDVASMFVMPAEHDYRRQEASTEPYPFASWRMHTGTNRFLGAALVSAEGWRLVDQAMTIDVAIGDRAFVPALHHAWDAISVDVLVPTTLRVRTTLASGEVHEASIELVDEIDQLELDIAASSGDLSKLRIGSSSAYACFVVRAGDAIVIGAPYTFTTTPQVRITEPQAYPNCVSFQPVEPGTGALVVGVDGLTLELPFTVLPS